MKTNNKNNNIFICFVYSFWFYSLIFDFYILLIHVKNKTDANHAREKILWNDFTMVRHKIFARFCFLCLSDFSKCLCLCFFVFLVSFPFLCLFLFSHFILLYIYIYIYMCARFYICITILYYIYIYMYIYFRLVLLYCIFHVF